MLVVMMYSTFAYRSESFMKKIPFANYGSVIDDKQGCFQLQKEFPKLEVRLILVTHC